jgi:beta-galactosidase GanA
VGQVEPEEGTFDFSFVDTLLELARERRVRLVLLRFATWKNNSPKYHGPAAERDGDVRQRPRLLAGG